MEWANKTHAEKLLYVQTNLNAPKNQFNKFGGYHYRSCEDILSAVKPLLAEVGAVLTLSDEMIQLGDRYYVRATAEFLTESASTTNTAYAREELTKKGMDGSQITGSSSSYARKYALNGLFLIDDVEDSDFTNDGTGEKKYQNEEINTKRWLPFIDNFLFEHPEYQDGFFAKYKLKKIQDVDRLSLETIDIMLTGMKKVIADEKEKTSIYGNEETF